MAICGECKAESSPGDVDALRHKQGCRWQTPHERIRELEEALSLARYEINRVLPEAGAMSTSDGLGLDAAEGEGRR